MTKTRDRIDSRCRWLGWKFKDAARAVGMSDKTLRKKCETPVLFSGLELKALSAFIPREDMDVIYEEIRGWNV